jgi:hypothetical protein
VDLLDANPRPLLFKDRGMAAVAVRLLSLLKHRVRASDERWRSEGVYEDVTWMLNELGTTEILVDPPGTFCGKDAPGRG